MKENAARDEHLLEELAALLGRAAQLRLEDLDRRLRGQRLREVAMEILRREVGPGAPIHYKEWYGLIESEGEILSLRSSHRCIAAMTWSALAGALGAFNWSPDQ